MPVAVLSVSVSVSVSEVSEVLGWRCRECRGGAGGGTAKKDIADARAGGCVGDSGTGGGSVSEWLWLGLVVEAGSAGGSWWSVVGVGVLSGGRPAHPAWGCCFSFRWTALAERWCGSYKSFDWLGCGSCVCSSSVGGLVGQCSLRKFLVRKDGCEGLINVAG